MASKRICRPGRSLFSLECQSPRPRHHRQTITSSQRRSVHHVPPLDHGTHFSQHGIPSRSGSLLSAPSFSMAWTEYQSFLTNQLNYITSDDRSTHTQPPLTIARRFARDPSAAPLFNYASQAHNNHFFFASFSPDPKPLSDFPSLSRSLAQDFKSVDALRDQLVYTAAGMFGVGYVWLAWVKGPTGSGAHDGTWRVLATYNAGTPYTLSGQSEEMGRGRLQGVDMNTSNATGLSTGNMTAGSFGAYSQTGREDAKRRLGGPAEVMPVLCVSTWQQVWLRDWGVGGKKGYLEAWWNAVDWSAVAARTPDSAMHRNTQGGAFDSSR